MSKSKIEWTESTWNPVSGCNKISRGCDNCYAERMAKRLQAMGTRGYENGFEVTLQKHNIDSSTLSQLVPLLFDLLNDDSPIDTLKSTTQNIALIKIHGSKLSKKYAAANGPGDIPKDEMWKIHTEFTDEYLSEILPNATDENMITSRFATSCYPEHGVPLILYFLCMFFRCHKTAKQKAFKCFNLKVTR